MKTSFETADRVATQLMNYYSGMPWWRGVAVEYDDISDSYFVSLRIKADAIVSIILDSCDCEIRIKNQNKVMTAFISCPCCGSENVATDYEQWTYKPPFGPAEERTLAVHTCLACEESGDFTGKGDETRSEAIAKAHRDEYTEIINWLDYRGISKPYIARCLQIPVSHFNYWDICGPSTEAIALLRLIRAYPWLLRSTPS